MNIILACALLVVGASAAVVPVAITKRDLSNLYIVGGDEARTGEFPWQVAIMVLVRSNFFSKEYALICGGSIIAPNLILTAAHCVLDDAPNADVYRIYAGRTSLKNFEKGAQVRNVEKIRVHSGWKRKTIENDIAIMKLSKNLRFSSVVSNIPLATENDTLSGQCIASGWGKTADNGTYPDKLLKAALPIVPLNECSVDYRYVNDVDITNERICAGKPQHGACNGDSGGPLVCETTTGDHVLAGITSFGVECGSSNHPTVFTRVSSYYDWILENDAPSVTSQLTAIIACLLAVLWRSHM